MAITFTPGETLQTDQTEGVQNPGDGDDDVDFFNAIFNNLKGRISATFAAPLVDNAFGALVDGAAETGVMTITSNGEITNVRFTDALGGTEEGGTSDGILLNDPSGLTTVDGHAILLTADAVNPDTIVYGIDAVTGELVFAIEMVVNDVSDSEKSIDLRILTFQPVFHGSPGDPDEPVDLGDFLRIEASDLTGLFDFSVLAATKFLYGVVGDVGGGFIVIGKDPAIKADGTPVNGNGAGDLINTSKGGGDTTIGVNNQHFTADANIATVEQGAYFTYTLGMAPGTFGDADGITPTNLVPVNEARLQVSQTQAQSTTPPGMKITTLNYDFADIASGQDFVGDLTDVGNAHGDPAALSRITVYDTDPNTVPIFSIDLSVLVPGPGNISPVGGYQVFFDSPNMVRIIGLDQKDWVEWETTGVHTRVLVEAVSGKWDIGAFEIDQPNTQSFKIGDLVVIDDDAPNVVLVGDGNAMLVLDESVGPNTAADPNSDDGAPLASQSITAANYLTTNTGEAGTDGAKSDEWTFVAIAANTDSGLVDTATDAAVLLNTETDGAGDIIRIVGTVNGGADEVVRWEINKLTGDVTVTQSRAVKHDDPTDPDEDNDDGVVPSLDDPAMLSGSNKIVVQREIIDNDDDSASGTVDLTAIFKFEDDGPDFDITLNGTAVIPLDETDPDGDEVGAFLAQFTITANNLYVISNEDFGSDGQGATPESFAFQSPGVNVDSGLVDSVSGLAVIYNLVGGVLIGTAGIGGPEVIRYEINATTGDVTASQSRAISHGVPGNNDETLPHPGSFKIVVDRTIFDGDGDFVTKSVDITVVVEIDDDGPVIGITGGSGAADGDLLVDAKVAPNSDSADLGEDGGSDQVKSIAITNFTGKLTGTVVTNGLTLTAEQASDTLVRYFLDEGDGTFGAGDTLFYTYELEDTGVDGIVDQATFTVHTALEGSNPDFSLEDLPAGQNGFGILASRQEEGGPLDPDGPSLVIIGRDAVYGPDGTFDNTSDTINTSKGGGPTTIGNSNQMIDGFSSKNPDGEGVYFVYVEDPVNDFISSFEPNGLTQNEADDFDNIQYLGGAVETDGAFFSVVQTQGNPKTATALITAFDLPATEAAGQGEQGRDLVDQLNSDLSGFIVFVDAIQFNNGPVIERVNGNTANVIWNGDGTAQVSGIAAGDTIHFFTASDHDLALIEGIAGKFDIGDFGLDLNNPVVGLALDFEVTIIDNDDDPEVDSHSVLVEGDLIV